MVGSLGNFKITTYITSFKFKSYLFIPISNSFKWMAPKATVTMKVAAQKLRCRKVLFPTRRRVLIFHDFVRTSFIDGP